ALGEVLGEDGLILAGIWQDGRYVHSLDVLREQVMLERPARESTTLVCVLTDARLTKTQAWLVARSASSGLARAVTPVATAYDGDVAFCLAGGHGRSGPSPRCRPCRGGHCRGDQGCCSSRDRRARMPGLG